MQIVAMVDGRARILSEAELADHIMEKSERVIRRPSALDCARYIIGHNGVNTGGGCPATLRYHGRTVFHESRGQRGSDDGCTVFFSSAAPVAAADANALGVLLAVGRHDQDVRGMPHYQLDWVSTNWNYPHGSIQF